jgi:hypothetical protein
MSKLRWLKADFLKRWWFYVIELCIACLSLFTASLLWFVFAFCLINVFFCAIMCVVQAIKQKNPTPYAISISAFSVLMALIFVPWAVAEFAPISKPALAQVEVSSAVSYNVFEESTIMTIPDTTTIVVTEVTTAEPPSTLADTSVNVTEAAAAKTTTTTKTAAKTSSKAAVKKTTVTNKTTTRKVTTAVPKTTTVKPKTTTKKAVVTTTNPQGKTIPAIVYWVPNGKSYHYSKGCRSLARSKTIYSGSLTEAKQAGKHDPCNNCVRNR